MQGPLPSPHPLLRPPDAGTHHVIFLFFVVVVALPFFLAPREGFFPRRRLNKRFNSVLKPRSDVSRSTRGPHLRSQREHFYLLFIQGSFSAPASHPQTLSWGFAAGALLRDTSAVAVEQREVIFHEISLFKDFNSTSFITCELQPPLPKITKAFIHETNGHSTMMMIIDRNV